MKMKMLFGFLIFVAACVVLADQSTDARRAQLVSLAERLKYEQGQINLGDGLASLNLPENYCYLDRAGTETVLTGIWGNPPSKEKTLGMIVPKDFDPFSSSSFCIVMSYEENGHIKDDDAQSINYSKLLKEMQEATREGSKERVKQGYPEVALVGWAAAPHYDQQTHKMYWAKEINFGDQRGENTLNYNMRLLGRNGVLVLNAVAGMNQLPDIEKATPDILGMVDFNAGQRYADYKPGVDKLATYGLAALVAGGVAAKAGLFKGLLVTLLALKKFIIIGLVAVAAFVKKLFRRKESR